MRILLIDGFPELDPMVDAALAALRPRHDVEHLRLHESGFMIAMSTAERRAYHDPPNNLLVAETSDAAALVRSSQALVFAAPMIAYNLPARTKGFLDRVFIDGVAFTFDDGGKYVPALRHIERLALLTRSPHGRSAVWSARNGAHRTILRTIRLHCALRNRSSHVRVTGNRDGRVEVARALRRW